MAEAGLFVDQRVELIEGIIVEMTPQQNQHFVTLCRVQQVLTRVFGEGYWVRPQGPLRLGDRSEPEPDVSVVRGTLEDYTDHPTSAVLVVEVSQTTLAFDRGHKAALYAAAEVPDYWVVNLIDRQLEIFRSPTPDDAVETDRRYAEHRVLSRDEKVAPLAAPESAIQVAELLS